MNLIPSVSIPPWVKRVIWWVLSPKGGLIILLVVLFAALVAVMWNKNVEGYIGPLLGLSGKDGIKNEILAFLGLSMGGVLLALQAVIANTRAKAMENAANAQAKANENTERGQRQERLKNAIEHLGHNAVSVRLGGAYELFHLAHDTKELRQTVLDILCAHIRRTTGEDEYRDKYKSKPSEEIQSLLTLLFVQEYDVFKGFHVNLQGSWLKGVELNEAHLEWAELSQVHLQGASFHNGNFNGALLFHAQMQEAHLVKARLDGAFLYGAQLQGANLGKARLRGADLFEAQLQGVNLATAKLQRAILGGAHLQGAYLAGAQMHGVTCEEDISGSFAQRIRQSIGQESDLSWVIFEGGLTQGDVDLMVRDLSGTASSDLREKLVAHIGKPESYELPKDSGVTTGAYTKEEAERWIVEYDRDVSEVLMGNKS